MLSLPSGYAAHIAQDTTALCNLFRITRKDAQVFRFTNHDRDIPMSDGIYKAATGFNVSDLKNSTGLGVDNLEIATIFDDASITEDDLEAGMWDEATLEIMSVVWSDPSLGVRLKTRSTLGQVRYDGWAYTVEALGLTDALTTNVGRLISPGCDANLGDFRCGKNLTNFTFPAEVTTVVDRGYFAADIDFGIATPQNISYFHYGLVVWLTGANTGRWMEIKYDPDDSVAIHLLLPMQSEVVVGDTFNIIAGCDKQFSTCVNKFSNYVNFRGFPHVPGTDRLINVYRLGG